MSESIKRSTKELKAEYANLALQAGNLQYEISCKERDLETLNNTMRELNFEFISASESEAKQAAEEKAKETPSV